METLLQHLSRYVTLTEKEISDLPGFLETITLRKKDFLQKEGQVCHKRYFVTKGCLRMYFIRDNGTEQITQFALENWWIADYRSLSEQTPSSFYIQALENTEVLALSFANEEALFDKIPSFERYLRKVMERTHAAAQFRIRFLFDYSREELYRHFSSHFPEFVQRVPQYMLASYLGFTPEYLSELRKKIR